MSRIVEELEPQGVEVTYENIAIFAIFAIFVSDEKIAERLKLSDNSNNNQEEVAKL